MKDVLSGRFDNWGRRNPRWLLATVVLLAIVATLLLLFRTEGTYVLYQAF